jgi:Ca2+-binding RTX toxin-like protein
MALPTLTTTPNIVDLKPDFDITDFLLLNFYGTSGNDDLTGNYLNNRMYGYDGNDELNGLSGNDSLYGGNGNDTLDGGTGNDWMFGGNNNDVIRDGDGDDRAYGGAGNDTIIQGDGVDYARGGSGNDYIYAYQGGVNTQYGDSGNDILYTYDERAAGHYAMDSNEQYGGTGNDKHFLVGGSINAFGEAGDDTFHFYSGPESAWHYAEGGTGHDHYFVENVDESLFIQIKNFDDANETITFNDGFGGWVSDLDSNNNGILDTGDTYVTGAGGVFTQIQNGDLNMIVWESGYLDADAFIVA